MICTTLVRRLVVAAALGCAGALGAANTVSELRGKHGELRGALASSPFQRPLVLQSGTDAAQPSGDVYAVLDHAFATVAAALQRGDSWCDVLLLQFNIKQCKAEGAQLRVAIGRKADQDVEDAFKLVFEHRVRHAGSDYLDVEMSAPQGPLGTSNYRLALKAVPLDNKRSFVHMSYSYATGAMARLATDAYLSTSGRGKVGFSVVGKDDADKPVLAGGLRGVAERNTMRYFLAIEAFLDTLDAPPPHRAERRQRQWFAATERHVQLREMPLEQYLALKRKG